MLEKKVETKQKQLWTSQLFFHMALSVGSLFLLLLLHHSVNKCASPHVNILHQEQFQKNETGEETDF